MLRIALCSKWHSHFDRYTKDINGCEDSEIAYVWDEDEERGQAAAKVLGVPFVKNYNELVAKNDVDAVCITAPTTMHKELCIAAANAKKHIFCEKTLTLTESDALEVKNAVTKNCVVLTMAYIQKTTGIFILIKKLIEQGVFGDISMMRIRNHVASGLTDRFFTSLPYWLDISQTGGGSVIDLGCHPMYLAEWYLGRPESVSATFGYSMGRSCEDSGVASFVFSSGKSIAVLESSYRTLNRSLYEVAVYGSKCVLFYNSADSYCTFEYNTSINKDFKLPVDGECTVAGKSSHICKVGLSTLKDDINPMQRFVNSCLKGEKTYFGIDEAVTLAEMVEGTSISNKIGIRYHFH